MSDLLQGLDQRRLDLFCLSNQSGDVILPLFFVFVVSQDEPDLFKEIESSNSKTLINQGVKRKGKKMMAF